MFLSPFDSFLSDTHLRTGFPHCSQLRERETLIGEEGMNIRMKLKSKISVEFVGFYAIADSRLTGFSVVAFFTIVLV